MKTNFWEKEKVAAVFTPGRFYLLVQRELVHHYKTLLTAAGFSLGALLVLSLLSGRGRFGNDVHIFLYTSLLFWGGLIATSLSFVELHRPPRNYFYLTLPASTFEKFVSKLLLTTVGYVAISLAGYFLVSLLALGLKRLIFGIVQPVFNPFSAEIWLAVRAYIVANSVFLFGALFFRKTHFIKTVLVLIGFCCALALLTGLVVFIVYFDYFQARWAGNLACSLPDSDPSSYSAWAGFAANLAYVVLWFFITPFFWVLGYLRLRESEVRNGV